MEKNERVLFEETLDGFDQGLGINALIGFVEWILLNRGQSGGRVFSDQSDERNLQFVNDLNTIFAAEEVSAIVIILGSAFSCGKEFYGLELTPNVHNAEMGRTQLGMKLVQTLGGMDHPTLARGSGVHILIRVRRKSKNRVGTDGFTVVDEDIDFYTPSESDESHFFWWSTTPSSRGSSRRLLKQKHNNDRYCWLLWTRERLRFDF